MTDPTDALATVRAVARPDVANGRAVAGEDSVTVLPLRETDDGTGVYPEATLTLVKELRALGVDASYLHSSERRVFQGTESASDAVLTIVLGMISAAAWDGVKIGCSSPGVTDHCGSMRRG